MNRSRPILIAEDDVNDRYLLNKAFTEMLQPGRLQFAYNGIELFKYLDGIANEAELPCLIVLDINMPSLDGITALEILKSNERYKNIPVVMFTADQNPFEKTRCLEIGAKDYLIKPLSYAETKVAVRLLCALSV